MRAWLLLVACGVSVAIGGTIEDSIEDSRYLSYGQTFAPYTRPLIGVDRDGNQPQGTCVLISPHWAITAAHVAVDMVSCSIAIDGGDHPVTKTVLHPDYSGDYGSPDIALVHTDKQFPLQTFPPLADGTEQLGTVVAASGYGITGRLSTGIVHGQHGLRAVTMRLVAAERSLLVCRIERSGTPLPYCIAPGDSGGGLWGKAADGSTRLVGINSCVTRRGGGRPRHVAGEESGHTRVSLFLAWIREVAGNLDEPCILAECHTHD